MFGLKKETSGKENVVRRKIKIYIIPADAPVSIPFYLYRTTPLKKIMYAYCKHMGRHSMVGLRFRFDGEPVYPEDTPLSKGIEDGMELEVYELTTGGGGICKNA